MKTLKFFLLPILALIVALGNPMLLHAQAVGIELEVLNQELASLIRERKFDRAFVVAQRAIDVAERNYGLDHLYVATSVSNMADLKFKRNHLVEARSLYERALSIREKALGPEHPAVAATLNRLAELSGVSVEAANFYVRSISIWEKSLGPNHPTVGESLFKLAEISWGPGEYQEAEPLYKRALAIKEQELGPSHPKLSNTLDSVAFFYAAAKQDFAEAEMLYKRALAIREQVLHKAMMDLGRLQVRGINLSTLQEKEFVLLQARSEVATSLSNLAWIYGESGDATKERLYKDRNKEINSKINPDNSNAATVLEIQAASYRRENRIPEAIELELLAARIRDASKR